MALNIYEPGHFVLGVGTRYKTMCEGVISVYVWWFNIGTFKPGQ